MTEPGFVATTRTAYDTVAADYAQLLGPELTEGPLDRALLAAFAELVHVAGNGPVADLGCGPGRVTAHLHSLGLEAFGIDLSPAMVEVARATYPELGFDEGSMTALDLADGSLGGVLAWYSVIHTPPERLPEIFAELRRVLRPGGHLLLAFQAGDDERVEREQAYGHAVPLVSYRLSVDRVVRLLGDAGLVVRARVVREPEAWFETTRQAFLLARKAG